MGREFKVRKSWSRIVMERNGIGRNGRKADGRARLILDGEHYMRILLIGCLIWMVDDVVSMIWKRFKEFKF
jgi:hypothetical protein